MKILWFKLEAVSYTHLSNLVEMIPNAYNLLGKAQNLGEHFYAQIGFSNNTYLVNVNNNAQLGNINSSNQAIYEFTRTANEAYTIKDMKTGLYLDVYQACLLYTSRCV